MGNNGCTLSDKLTAVCCLLDSRFVLLGVGAETHEVKPAHMKRRAFQEINRYNCSIVNASMGAWCGFRGNNSIQCCAKKAVCFITPTHHAGIMAFMLRVTGIGGLQGDKGRERNENMTVSVGDQQQLHVGVLIYSLSKARS